MDDTLKRIKEDMKNSFISVDTFNNKLQKDNRRYDPQKHLETLLEIRDAVWIEGEEDERSNTNTTTKRS